MESQKQDHPHGPDNAEHELKKAYKSVMEAGTVHFWDRQLPPGVDAYEVVTVYKRAFHAYRQGDRLSAERWARTAKHLARALWHEATLAYVAPRSTELPFLTHAADEYDLRYKSDTTGDLLDSLESHMPDGKTELHDSMRRFLSKGRRHLQELENPPLKHELLRAEHIMAAHEYGRVIECMTLAFEAEGHGSKAA